MNRGMNHPFVIAEVAATRGKGVRATRSLQRGQIVLREEPLFEIDPAMYACPIMSWANIGVVTFCECLAGARRCW